MLYQKAKRKLQAKGKIKPHKYKPSFSQSQPRQPKALALGGHPSTPTHEFIRG